MTAMLTARTMEEVLLYLDLNFCDCCKAPDGLRSWREQRGRALVSVHAGGCPTCHTTASFEFEIRAQEVVIPPAIGGAVPSQIIDPGEFLWLSDQAASGVPVDISSLPDGQITNARLLLEDAVVALEEVRKFIPDGFQRVPDEAFFSARGKSLYRSSPERFDRELIEERLDFYRHGLAQLSV
ncbi:hypothetical protein AB0C84_45190 [Actinomadura sp. NPDC048955]|uniref:hypothetical protein n=1 Tax=Actinomadura sp. NPDC048955 TaxID=3158228 RepID=UPI0033C65E6F